MKYTTCVTLWAVFIMEHAGRGRTMSDCPTEGFLKAKDYRQNLTSPGYPGPYARPASCKWIVTSDRDDGIIRFEVIAFEIESSQFCYRDQLGIQDGRWRSSLHLAAWCGRKNPGTQLKTTAAVAMVSFQALTEGSDYPGFILQYWETGNGKLPEGEQQYSLGNLILGGVFGLILILIFITLLVLVFIRNVNYNRQRHLHHIRVYS